ncbi:MAG: hypothetical protein R2791_02000 [Saprospiraceae bacterium]
MAGTCVIHAPAISGVDFQVAKSKEVRKKQRFPVPAIKLVEKQCQKCFYKKQKIKSPQNNDLQHFKKLTQHIFIRQSPKSVLFLQVSGLYFCIVNFSTPKTSFERRGTRKNIARLQGAS